jgi:hypothetical protein
MKPISRRLLLAGSAALPAVPAWSGPGAYTLKHVTPPDWYWRAMRWLTMNLVQDDPGKADLDFWLDYLKQAHVDAASWNSGGIVAMYPTNIPYHRRNERLENSDPLGYLIEGCRRMGLVVTTRVDHHATYPEAAKAHPEWICRDPQGRMQPHWATPELFLTCTLGPYNEIFMTEVMRELVTMYRVDGFNHNRWAPQVMCYCEWCRTAFRKASGMELPVAEDSSDRAYARYLEFREDRIFELWDTWNAAIQKVNPNAFVLPGIGSERDRLNMSKVRARAKTLYLDYQGRRGLTPPWMAGKKGKEMRAVLGDKPPGITFSVGHEAPYRWKDSVQSAAEIKLWVASGAAHGLRPKMAKFAGTLHDRRWLKPVEEIYEWLWRAEPYLRNTGYPVATVGILYSQQNARFYTAARERGHDEEDYSKGLYHALIEARIPNDIVHEDLLEESELDRFRVLVLPNVACLSDRQCEQISRYVQRGGSLVATFESSLRDELGRPREDFALGSLFGVRPAGPVQGPMRNSYLRIVKGVTHPVLRGFEDASRMINGVYRVPVTPAAHFPVQPLMLVAPYPDLPMEEVYPRDLDKNVPELYLRETGPSRIAYIPFDIDRTFWEVLDVDHGRLLANIIRWAAHDDMPVEVKGPGVLDVTVWRQEKSMAVHLVNLTNPMMMKGPARDIFPVGAQSVRVRIPSGKVPAKVRLLTADIAPRKKLADGWLSVDVPSVGLNELIAIEL